MPTVFRLGPGVRLLSGSLMPFSLVGATDDSGNGSVGEKAGCPCTSRTLVEVGGVDCSRCSQTFESSINTSESSRMLYSTEGPVTVLSVVVVVIAVDVVTVVAVVVVVV